jgi:hypothetical protein
MGLKGIPGKAAVVMAMALMAWFSPMGAEMKDEWGCDYPFCVGMSPDCDLESIEILCAQICSSASSAMCWENHQNCSGGDDLVICFRD